ncbi:MAG TPA: sensor domain-containing diguanylate cyclase, partial [Desulfosalsimonadaceae bacterium]|nr:sensor domain-containing diguanylate cyclase [Desulfosalsimonadaceae bacterium]
MESPNNDGARATELMQRLETVTEHAMEALELCASMGDYQSSITKFKNRKDIFERAVQGLRQVIPISFYAFYAVDESQLDIGLEHCDAAEQKDYISRSVEHLIEKGVVALAFREKRTLTARSHDRGYHLLIHALATTSRPYGIFFCFLEKKPLEWRIVDKMITIICKSTCYALENFDLYQQIDQKNAALTEKNNQLSRSELLYRNTFENTGNPTVITDADGLLTYCNSQFAAFSACDRADLTERKNLADFITGPGRVDFAELLAKSRNDDFGEPAEFSFENLRGERRTVFLKISPLEVENRYIVSLNDVTAIKEAERQLEFQAFHDPLTHLPNRVLFQDRLAQAIKKKKRYSGYNFAVVFIDLDRFKSINDTLGHNIGDQLLMQTARRISDAVREVDTVARYGGDEFLILLENIPDQSASEAVTQRILERFAEPVHIGGHEIVVTLSIGVLLGGWQAVEQTDVV